MAPIPDPVPVSPPQKDLRDKIVAAGDAIQSANAAIGDNAVDSPAVVKHALVACVTLGDVILGLVNANDATVAKITLQDLIAACNQAGFVKHAIFVRDQIAEKGGA